MREEDLDLPDESPFDEQTVDSVFKKYSPSLLKVLKSRKKNPEDVDVYYATEDLLQSIAKDLKLNITVDEMMNEVFFDMLHLNEYTAENALADIKEKFNAELEEN